MKMQVKPVPFSPKVTKLGAETFGEKLLMMVTNEQGSRRHDLRSRPRQHNNGGDWLGFLILEERRTWGAVWNEEGTVGFGLGMKF